MNSHKSRLARVLSALQQAGIPQMFVTDPRSIWYLTGISVEPFERLFALYLNTDGREVLFLNRLYTVPESGLEEIWFTDTDDQIGLLASVVTQNAPLGIDKEWTARFLLPLLARLDGVTPVLASQCVDDCRAVKDAEEILLMRDASRINDLVISRAADYIRGGMTEKQVAAFIDEQYLLEGCEGNSFTTIVSFGANAADPHHGPDDTVLVDGQCVLIDMGCKKDRYCSDMTRTFFYGHADPAETAIHDLVREANERAEAIIRPGVVLKDVDAAARDYITAAGYGKEFNHRLGHFIGQTDHEQGDVSAVSTIVAKPGMIFSIEPGVYLPGRFGVRVEDLVLVTEDGCEVLNHVDKHWRVLTD